MDNKEIITANKNIKFGIIISYLSMIITFLLYFFFTPYCIEKLGDSEYGLRTFANSLCSYLSILSFGLSSTYIKYRIIQKNKDTENGEKKFNAIYFLTFLVIGILSTIIGISFALLLKYNVIKLNNYSLEETKLISNILICLVINTSLSFPLGIFSQFIIAKEKLIWSKVSLLMIDVLVTIFSFIALFVGFRVMALAIITLIVNIFISILNICFAIFYLKMKFSFKLKKEDFSILKSMFGFAFFVGLNTIIDELNSQTDPIIIGIVIGAEAVTIFNLARQFRSYLLTMSIAISSSFTPRINEYAFNNEEEKINKIFILVSSFQMLVLFFVCGGFISCGKEFIFMWIGKDKIEVYYLAIWLMVFNIVPLSQNVSIEIQRAYKKHKFRALVYLGISISNIIIRVILCKKIGIMGCVYGTIITLVLGQYICINYYNAKVIKLPIKKYWIRYIRIFIVTLFSIILTFLLSYVLPRNVEILTMFLIKVSIFSIIYIILNLLVNKKICFEIINKIRTRGKVNE